ncbi:MAG: energy transducer TonB [Pseudomonadota bacterium]|nr:energy transducer TonB [Pseudomonadota bacterium]
MMKYLYISLISLLSGCASSQLTADSQDNSYNESNFADLALSTDAEFNALWKVQRRVDPGYTADAARNGLSGCVTVKFIVNRQGQAVVQKITDSFPFGVFDKTALNAIKQWRWQPTQSNTEKTPALTEVKFDYMVQGTKNKAPAEKHCNITIPASY